nr:MAG TPA: hypothetical protein [Caudoviricetes sp.]
MCDKLCPITVDVSVLSQISQLILIEYSYTSV